MIKRYYENGKCPDCGTTIPDDCEEGMSCANCYHAFWGYGKRDGCLSSSEILDMIYEVENGEENFLTFAGAILQKKFVWDNENSAYKVENIKK
jgi:hypothetical protein